MTPSEGLVHLANEAGIEARYWDIQGGLHHASAQTLRSLLTALGIPADTDGDIFESRAMLAAARWRCTLPPVVIVSENGEIDVPIRLPVIEAARIIRWSIHLESGEIRTADCDVSALPIEETGQSNGRSMALFNLKLAPLPLGYHTLRLAGADIAVSTIIVAPRTCYLPDKFVHRRSWGIAAQLYALKSGDDWGMGDFGDLRTLIDHAAAAGADVIGLNPLHALFLDTPDQASPYSPSSRLFRNPLYLDMSAIPDLAECAEASAFLASSETLSALSAVRAAARIDYRAIAAIKLPLLKKLHSSFERNHIRYGTARGAAFREYLEKAGAELDRLAAFQTLSEILGTHDWRRWPAEWQSCGPQVVSRLQREEADHISFFQYLQWLAEVQVSRAADEARAGGMAVGLYNDLSISVDAAGADHWAHQDLFAGDLRIGAPPDPFNEAGQEWGIVPLNPRRLQATAYAHYIALLRANMGHAGALRIDHVMGMQRLFLIPDGAPAKSGTYVRYPLEEMLAITALESRRNSCVVVGEDLGTVPDGFRARMAAANVLSSRVLYFERTHDRFFSPGNYPTLAAISASTHDLATLHGFWRGQDLSDKQLLGTLASGDDVARVQADRANDKVLLEKALAEEGLLSMLEGPSQAGPRDWSLDLLRAVHLYLARTPSLMLLLQLDDVANEVHQANLPGSTTEYPNWRRRLSRTLLDLLGDPVVRAQLDAVSAERTQRRNGP